MQEKLPFPRLNPNETFHAPSVRLGTPVGRFVFSVVVLVLALAGSADAEWGRTADQLIGLPFGYPSICSDGNGGLWATGRGAGGVGVIHINRDGDTTWGQETVTALPNQPTWGPVLAAADSGDVLLGMNLEIVPDVLDAAYIQRINLNRELVWGEHGIALDTSSQRQGIMGIYKGPLNDTYLIYWFRSDRDFTRYDPRLQLINGAGEFLWGIGGKGLGSQYSNFQIVVTSDQSIVTAQTLTQAPAMEVIKINSEADLLWDLRLSTLWEDVSEEYITDAESDREGGVILAYAYVRSIVVAGNTRMYIGVNALRISVDGDSLWTRRLFERDYIPFEEFWKSYPIINYAGSGRFFIAWVAESEWPYALQVAALNVAGDLSWQEPVVILTGDTGRSGLCGVDSDSGVCYVWNDYDPERHGNGETTYQLWGQRISLEGERLWGDRGRIIQASFVTSDYAVTNGAGGVITMVEFGGGGTVQMINRNGGIGAVLPDGVDDDFGKQTPFIPVPQLLIYPNPANGSFNLSFDLPSPQRVTVRLNDLLGREVLMLPGAEYGAGKHQVTLNASGMASGRYFVTLRGPSAVTSQPVILVK